MTPIPARWRAGSAWLLAARLLARVPAIGGEPDPTDPLLDAVADL